MATSSRTCAASRSSPRWSGPALRPDPRVSDQDVAVILEQFEAVNRQAFARAYSFEIREARDVGGGTVFIFATHGGEGRLSGVPVRGETGYLYRVRDGKVARVGF